MVKVCRTLLAHGVIKGLDSRACKKSGQTERKYVVAPQGVLDITGELPTILLEINPSTGSLTKTYIYANSEILAQHDGDTSADRYFYLHDRLGSVRLAIDDEGAVQDYYTYEPFGQTIESGGTLDNAFMFTGQLYDEDVLVQRELDDFHLRVGE